MEQIIVKHLMTRPIAPIVMSSMEKEDEIALKVMIILDYYVQKCDLYGNISAVPNLFDQLFKFKSYASFQYYKYVLDDSLKKKLLKCEFCDLLSTYEITITHMALNHDKHLNVRYCQWCKKTDLKTHKRFKDFKRCYSKYGHNKFDLKKRWRINEYLGIIRRFYKIVSGVAKKLGVHIQRNENSTTTTDQKVVTIELDDDDDDDDNDDDDDGDKLCSEISLWRSSKGINLDALAEMFQEAMKFFWTNIKNELYQIDNNNTITIDDEDDSTQEYNPTCLEKSSNQTNMSMSLTPPLQPNSIITESHYPDKEQPLNICNISNKLEIMTPPILANNIDAQPTQFVERVTATEMVKFKDFVASTINNIYDETIKRRTLKQIQQVLLQASAEDMSVHFQVDGFI